MILFDKLLNYWLFLYKIKKRYVFYSIEFIKAMRQIYNQMLRQVFLNCIIMHK